MHWLETAGTAQKGVRHLFASAPSTEGLRNSSRCLTSLMKKRETQAARVLAVLVGNHRNNRNNGRLRL
jgi:hypothetical protein